MKRVNAHAYPTGTISKSGHTESQREAQYGTRRVALENLTFHEGYFRSNPPQAPPDCKTNCKT
jgi:hypothetical protein